MRYAGRLPGLDGLRGLALLLVVFFHLNLLGIGWAGVQLFFVLSGFLITRSLLDLRGRAPAGRALRVFYTRRALRIFPAFYLYLALLLAASVLVDLGPAGARAQQQAPWAAAYLYNWFQMTPAHQPTWFLDHTWSLAIEEQFYLLWPALVLGLAATGLRALLLVLVAAGPALRLTVWWLWPVAGEGDKAYVVAICTVSQLDAFAAGALLCFAREPLQRLPRPALWLCGAALAAYVAGALASGPGIAPDRWLGLPLDLGYPNTLPARGQFTWGYSALNLLAALAIGLAAYRGCGGWLLEQAWLRGVGRISYGAYLLHFPLAHLTRPAIVAIHEATGWGPYASILAWVPAYLLLLLALAGASYYGFERAFLRRKPAGPEG